MTVAQHNSLPRAVVFYRPTLWGMFWWICEQEAQPSFPTDWSQCSSTGRKRLVETQKLRLIFIIFFCDISYKLTSLISWNLFNTRTWCMETNLNDKRTSPSLSCSSGQGWALETCSDVISILCAVYRCHFCVYICTETFGHQECVYLIPYIYYFIP
jgi:hypothetical protein